MDRAVDDPDGPFSKAFLQSVLAADEADNRLLLRCYILRRLYQKCISRPGHNR